MDQARRQYLTAKFPALNNVRPMDPALNKIVQAQDDAERITAGAHGRDNAPLFDPAWSPAMWERANKAVHDLRIRTGLPDDDPNRIRLNSHDYDDFDLDDLPDDAVVIWAVDTKTAFVGRPPHKTERPTKRVDWFTSTLQLAQEIDDYLCYGGEDNPRNFADYELRCDVNIAPDCTAPLSLDVNDFGGGTTRMIPVRRGQFILLFRCCRACEALAGKIAANTYKSHVIEARADLPRGAVIMPNPEPDVNPDAWA